MSEFEKIVLPLLECGIESSDLTSENGFIDCFTEDIDRPTYENEFFIVFNDDIRTEKSEKIARKLSFYPWLKKTYVKRVDGVPYFVYSFHVKPEIAKLYDKPVYLNAEQKSKIIKFWGFSESVTKSVLQNNILVVNKSHNMPAQDYYEYDGYGLEILK